MQKMSKITIDQYLNDQMLIASPALQDPYFAKTVTLLCEQSAHSTVGLVINRPLNLTINNVLKQMKIEFNEKNVKNIPIMQGGPMQPERGFVIHSPKGSWESTIKASGGFFITTSRDILESLAKGTGPDIVMIVLGYTGWEPKQLMQEIIENSWINCPATKELIFDTSSPKKWHAALESIGANPIHITDEPGHA